MVVQLGKGVEGRGGEGRGRLVKGGGGDGGGGGRFVKGGGRGGGRGRGLVKGGGGNVVLEKGEVVGSWAVMERGGDAVDRGQVEWLGTLYGVSVFRWVELT